MSALRPLFRMAAKELLKTSAGKAFARTTYNFGKGLYTSTTKAQTYALQTFTKENIRAAGRYTADAGEKLGRFSYILDSGFVLADQLLNHDDYQDKGRHAFDVSNNALALGLGILSIRGGKGSKLRTMARYGVWTHAAANVGLNAYNFFTGRLSQDEINDLVAEQKRARQCTKEDATAALNSTFKNDILETNLNSTSNVDFGLRPMVSARSLGNFVRLNFQLSNNRKAAGAGAYANEGRAFYLERKSIGGSGEAALRLGYHANSDPNALQNDGVGSQLVSPVLNWWDSDAFFGVTSKFSFRPAQMKERLQYGEVTNRREHELKWGTNFGVSNQDDTRSLVLEYGFSIKVPGSFWGLFDRKQWGYERSLRMQLKASHNPLIVYADGRVKTKTAWDMVKETLFLQASNEGKPMVRVLYNGDVIDEHSAKGQERLKEVQDCLPSAFGLLVSEKAMPLDEKGSAYMSAINFQLPSETAAMGQMSQEHKVGNKGYLYRQVDGQRQLFAIRDGGALYYTTDAIDDYYGHVLDATGRQAVLEQADRQLAARNKDRLHRFEVNGRTVYAAKAGQNLETGLIAQGAECLNMPSHEGLFVKGGKRDVTPVVKAAPQNLHDFLKECSTPLGYGDALKHHQRASSVSSLLLDMVGDQKAAELAKAWGFEGKANPKAYVAKRLTEMVVVSTERAGLATANDNFNALRSTAQLETALLAMDSQQLAQAYHTMQDEFKRKWVWDQNQLKRA